MTACSISHRYRKGPSEPRSERNELPRRVRAPVLTCPLLIFLFFFFSRIVVIIVPTAAHPSSCNTCPNHKPSFSRRFFPLSFLSPIPLVLRSQTNIYRLNATATRHPCALSFISYFCLSSCSHFSRFYSIIGAPEAAATILS